MTDVYDFDECIKKGEFGEDQVKTLFKNFYLPIAERFLKCEGYKFGVSQKQTKKQRSGQDGQISSHFNYDVKLNRYHEEKFILLELFHIGINYPGITLGWFLTSSSDVIFWLWESKPGKLYLFHDGFYLFLHNIRAWLIGNNIFKSLPLLKNSKPSERKGLTWDTYNLYIKPDEFPPNAILKIRKATFKTALEESYFYKFFENKEE